jgi:hypothetical protein
VDAGEKVSREFVVARGDGAKVLEFVEEALDQIPLAVECKVAGQWGRAAGVGRNHWGDVPLSEAIDQSIGVLCHVANQSLWIDVLEQWLCADEIVGLSRREQELDRIAESIDEGVNFGA